MKEVSISDLIEKPISGEWGSEPDSEANGIPVIRNTNFSNDGRIDLNDVAYRSIPEKKLTKKKLLPGDIIIEKSGGSENQPVGRVVFFDIKDGRNYLFSNFTSALRPKKEVESKYIHYALLNSYLRGGSELFQNKTTGIRNLQLDRYLDKVKIPLPSLEEQQAIVAKLDRAQRLIDIDKAMLAKYDQLIQSVFLEMFGDPVTNPKGWEVFELKALTKAIFNGNTPKGGKKVYVDEGILFLRSQNVWRNRLDLEDVAYIDKRTHDQMSRSSLKNGDILMTKTGRFNTENSSLGRAAMYRGKDDQANLNGHVYLIRLNKSVNNEFVLYILITEHYREYIRRVCVGGIDKRQINKTHLEEFLIIYPPVEKQKKFTDFLRNIDCEKRRIRKSLKRSEELFSSLVQEVFG